MYVPDLMIPKSLPGPDGQPGKAVLHAHSRFDLSSLSCDILRRSARVSLRGLPIAGREPEAFIMGHIVRCRFCGQVVRHTFVDLGMSPLCETCITAEQLNHMEPFYPLHAYVCEHWFLVQLEEFVAPGDIFSEYAYFSSDATSRVNAVHLRAVSW